MNWDQNKGFNYIGYSHSERTRKSKNKIQKLNKSRWKKEATWSLKPRAARTVRALETSKTKREIEKPQKRDYTQGSSELTRKNQQHERYLQAK